MQIVQCGSVFGRLLTDDPAKTLDALSLRGGSRENDPDGGIGDI